MSVKKSSKCIDLDTEEHIYHLKVRPQSGPASAMQLPKGLLLSVELSEVESCYLVHSNFKLLGSGQLPE